MNRDRRWLSRALHKFMWSDAMIPLIEEMDAGWLDGGCRSCACSLQAWMTRSDTIEPGSVDLMIVASQNHPADHVVAHIRWQGQDWYLDANGMSSQKQLLRYWEQEERLLSPTLRTYDSALLDSVGIPAFSQVSDQLTALLFAQFGSFSSTWLELQQRSLAKAAKHLPHG